MLLPILLLYAIAYPDSIVAQAVGEAGPWLTLVNLGVGGIFLWAFTTGKVHSDKELQRVIDRCDADFKRVVENNHQLTVELRAQNKEARETLVPALIQASTLFARYLDRTPTPPTRGRE